LTQHRAVFRVITLGKFAAAQVVIGVLLFLCALTFYYFAVLRIDYSSFATALCYVFGGDGRFYLPLLILVVAVAVLPVTWAANNLFAGKRILTAASMFIFFAGTCLG